MLSALTLTSFTALFNVCLFSLLLTSGAGNLEVCAEVGCDRQSATESLEGAMGANSAPAATAVALLSPRKHSKTTLSPHRINSEMRQWISQESLCVAALLPFSRRFSVRAPDLALRDVCPERPQVSSQIMQSPPIPWPTLQSASGGGVSLAAG